MVKAPRVVIQKWLLMALFLMLGPLYAYTQQHILRVVVTDSIDLPVSNASVRISGRATPADSSGQISLRLPSGKYQVSVTAVGYIDTVFSLHLTGDLTVRVLLRSTQQSLQTVIVTGSRSLQRNQMSIHTMEMAQVQKLPVILGEVDPMKTITLLPGIKSGGDASAGIYVRGGGPDQNLVLLDGIPVYNPNHLLGFFSVFNGDAIKNIEVIKGGIPAEYGGRLSSVIAVNSKDGHRDSLKASGGIGLISSRVSLEGPVIKNRSAFNISFRRTYIDQIAKLIAPDSLGRNGYFFYDVNARADFQIDNNNGLYLTFYTGRDKFSFVDDDDDGPAREFNAIWGNTIAGLTWKQQINKQLKQELAIVRNDFNLDSRVAFGTNSIVLSSGLTDYQVKNDWTWAPQPWMSWKAGLQYSWHNFRPGAGESNQGIQEFKSRVSDQRAGEAAAYISADINLDEAVNIIAGLRYSYFNQVGPSERVIYGPDGAPTGETETYKRGESIARYHYPEPRISLQYRFNNTTNVKLSYTRTYQYLHLATTSAATFPSDLWVPSSRLIKPGIADQVAAGFFKSLSDGRYELSVETYYKTLGNQIEFKPGARLLLNQNIEGEMIFGKGKAYGIEVFLQKKTGRFNGWIGYTLSRSERTFPDMNNGKAFPYRYDRTHDISVVANYQLSSKWHASAVFVYGTGNALTMPTGRFVYSIGYNGREGQPVFTNINQYDKINDYRMPAYHRMDLAFTYTRKPNNSRRYKSSWVFGLYNLYNRENPYFIYIDADEEERTIKGKKVFLFPVIPGITWNFKF